MNDKMFSVQQCNIETLKYMSDLLTGQVHALMKEGWSEQQARDLVVVFETLAARKTES